RLRAQAVHPTDEPLIEFRVHAHGIENLGAVLHEPGQDLVDVGDGECVVRAIRAPRTCRTGAPSVPGLTCRVALAHEEDVFSVVAPRDQDRHRLGLVEAGQIIEVTVLPVRVFDVVVAVAYRRRGQDGDGVAAHE